LPGGRVAPFAVEFYPEDYWEQVTHSFGPVTAPTTVTLTARVREYPGVTGTLSVLVRHGVQDVEMPQTVVAGVPFTATVRMHGPSDIDRSIWFHGSNSTCTPSEPVLRAGATSVSATCTATTDHPVRAIMGIWIDQTFNYSEEYDLVTGPGG
jgi:hypothetical protein